MTTPRRYVTAVLTVEVPDDDVWDQILDRRLRDVVEELGLPLAPCDWTPDLDTVTDGLGAAPGTVSVLDLNPPQVRPVELECHCDAGILDGHLSTCVYSNDD